MSRRPIGTRCAIARTRTGSGSRRNNHAASRTMAPSRDRGGAFVLATISLSLLHPGLARVGDDLLELGHAEHAGHAIFSDDEGRRAAEAEGLGLVVVPFQDRIDDLGAAGEIALQAIHVDAGSRDQF